MKRLLAITLSIFTLGSMITASAYSSTNSTALTAANANAPQIRIRIGQDRGRHRGWRNRDRRYRARSYVQTRYVRYGYRTFRETYQVTQWPNGQMQTTLISRQRVS